MFLFYQSDCRIFYVVHTVPIRTGVFIDRPVHVLIELLHCNWLLKTIQFCFIHNEHFTLQKPNKRASNFICRFVLDDIQCKPVCNHTQWANVRKELYNLCDQCSRLGSLNLLIDDCVNNEYWNFLLGSDSYKQLAYER